MLIYGDIDSRKSTIGFVFTVGGTVISWASNLQKIVTLFTTEAEYVAATESEKGMIWLHGFLNELVRSRRWAFHTVTVRVQFFLPKIQLFIQSQSTYKQNTTLSVILLKISQ